uniref:Uncharacterized protein n=1 Tax=Oryza meridionalis TaxID=40149 RepID=A0A0E0FA03_9ORYZ
MEVDSGRNGTGHGQIVGPDDEIPAGGDAKRSREEGGRNTTTCEGYQSMDEDEDNDYYNDDSISSTPTQLRQKRRILL